LSSETYPRGKEESPRFALGVTARGFIIIE